MTAQWILGWWNLIYVVPFALAMLYLGIYTLSGWTFGHTDADLDHDLDTDLDADVDADADLDADADVDADADIDADADVDADVDADADTDTEVATGDHAGIAPAEHHVDAPEDNNASVVLAALNWIGVGKVPLSIVLMALLLTWGCIGFLTNQIMRGLVPQMWMVAAVSLPLAAIGSALITSGMTRMINRYMPLHETYARRRHDLLGATGEAIYPIDEKFGMVNIRDSHGDLFQVPCRLRPGNPTIDKGARAQLVAYSAKEGMFYVIPGQQSQGMN